MSRPKVGVFLVVKNLFPAHDIYSPASYRGRSRRHVDIEARQHEGSVDVLDPNGGVADGEGHARAGTALGRSHSVHEH